MHSNGNSATLAISIASLTFVCAIPFGYVPAIPFPFSKDDHQYFNAKFYVDKNFGWLINEHEIFENYFYQFYIENIQNKKMLYNKAEKMSNFSFEESWSENFNVIEQTFYEN